MTSGTSLPPGIDVSGIRIALIESLEFLHQLSAKKYFLRDFANFQTTCRVFFLDRHNRILLLYTYFRNENRILFHLQKKKKLSFLSFQHRQTQRTIVISSISKYIVVFVETRFKTKSEVCCNWRTVSSSSRADK